LLPQWCAGKRPGRWATGLHYQYSKPRPGIIQLGAKNFSFCFSSLAGFAALAPLDKAAQKFRMAIFPG
jgi:hypothetical protein